MAKYKVYTRWNAEICETSSLEYHGTWMGERYLSVTIKAPSVLQPNPLTIGCYIIYREERFELNYVPKPTKSAKAYTKGDAFVYENVKFDSLAYELVRCRFEDYVLNDNQLFTSKPIFAFYAATVQELADRIQANLNRLYGDGVWKVICNSQSATKSNINVSVSNINVSEALALAYEKFGATYSVRDRVITIGESGTHLDKIFQYGDGLIKISEITDSSKMYVTRAKVFGSTKNMPHRYYNQILNPEGKPYLPDAMNVDCLMLPSFPERLDPYIENNNAVNLYGVREATILFDGSMESSDGLPEIYPTIEGLTRNDLIAAGIPCDLDSGDNGNLDEIAGAEQITDSGVADENGKIGKSDFIITLKDIGFDINEYTQTSDPNISFNSGMLSGREFSISSVTKEGNKYRLVCSRVYDSGLRLYFPNETYNAKAGDKFILTEINMPDVYVKAASVKMANLANIWLMQQLSYSPSFDVEVSAIMMARQHDDAVLNGGISLYETIHEGDMMPLLDNTLGVSGDSTIDNLTIYEGSDSIPTYKITLKEEKTVSGIKAIQAKLTELEAKGFNVDENLIRQHIRQLGGQLFLSKKTSDTAEGTIRFKAGAESDDFTQGQFAGTGWGAYKDANGNAVLEADRVIVRKTLEAAELLVNQISFTLGDTVFSCGGCEVTSVEKQEEYYRCFYDNKNKTRFSGFQVGDGARSQVFDADFNGVIRYSWREVVGVGEDYVDLSKESCDDGSVAPQKGDNLVQFGHKNDATRQNAIIIGSGNTPRIYQYVGIELFNIPEPQTKIEPNNNQFSGIVNFKPGSAGAANIADLPQEIQNEVMGVVNGLEFGKANLLRNTSFTGDYLSRQLDDSSALVGDSEMFSPSLEHWTVTDGNPTVVERAEAVSGFGLKLLQDSGVEQKLLDKILPNESYVLSYNLNGYEPTFSIGGYEHTEVSPSATIKKVVVVFKAVSDANTFELRQLQSGCTISNIQLERGTIPSTYGRSVYDNESSLAYYNMLKYVSDAIENGKTSIYGGLILSSLIQLGKWNNNGTSFQNTSGMSGYYNEDNDVAFWGGGDYAKAVVTVAKCAINPLYVPSDADAKYVVTHGGRVIMQDAIVRGTVYADSGKFKGRVEAENGYFKGRVEASEGVFNGEVNATSGNFKGRVEAEEGYFKGELNIGKGANTILPNGSGKLGNGSVSWNVEGEATFSGEVNIVKGLTIPTSYYNSANEDGNILLELNDSYALINANPTAVYLPDYDYTPNGKVIIIKNISKNRLMIQVGDFSCLNIYDKYYISDESKYKYYIPPYGSAEFRYTSNITYNGKPIWILISEFNKPVEQEKETT